VLRNRELLVIFCTRLLRNREVLAISAYEVCSAT